MSSENLVCKNCNRSFKTNGTLKRHLDKKVPCTQSLNSTVPNSLGPLIKWSGGKSDEIKYFIKYIPTDYKTYIEPFIGGGAVFFHLNPKCAVIADVHSELVDFYTAIANNKANYIKTFMDKHPNEEDEYYRVRDNIEPKDYLDRACQFYYLRKTCYRGMLRYNKSGKFNIPFGRYKTINYTDLDNSKYTELLSRTTILKSDFEDIFKNYNSPDNFIFLDPPYDSKFTDYGYCEFTQEHHKRLAECFRTTQNKCLMVIGKTEFIVNLYKDYIVDEFDKNYRFKIHSGRVGEEINTKHLIIKNY